MEKNLLQQINENLIIAVENQEILDAKLNALLGGETSKSIGGGGIKPPVKS